MKSATREQAIAHPNWSMGAKISVDSATMMNKGLEMIEAAYLFGMPSERVDVVIHPQSVVHSLVEYADGSTLAQLGPPDMRAPIACAWAWPGRVDWDAPALDLPAIGALTFLAPDEVRFPALAVARQALKAGAGAPAAMNAANEIAVAAFLCGGIGFLDIANVASDTLDQMNGAGELAGCEDDDAVDWALMIDAAARRVAAQVRVAIWSAIGWKRARRPPRHDRHSAIRIPDHRAVSRSDYDHCYGSRAWAFSHRARVRCGDRLFLHWFWTGSAYRLERPCGSRMENCLDASWGLRKICRG